MQVETEIVGRYEIWLGATQVNRNCWLSWGKLPTRRVFVQISVIHGRCCLEIHLIQNTLDPGADARNISRVQVRQSTQVPFPHMLVELGGSFTFYLSSSFQKIKRNKSFWDFLKVNYFWTLQDFLQSFLNSRNHIVLIILLLQPLNKCKSWYFHPINANLK